MSAEDKLRGGDLEAALEDVKQQIRDRPADPKHRVFLFQLLSVLGQWERALTQLNVLADLDPKSLLMAQAYRAAIQGEVFRAQIYAGKHSPLVFGEPQRWLANLVEALRVETAGAIAQAQAMREEAFEEAPAVAGKVNGDPFYWIADSDGRLGPVLEALVEGKLFWIPLNRIDTIDLDEPKDLRDMVWCPARFRWTNGGEAVGFIPTRYPGTESSTDSSELLARKTSWTDIGGGVYHGVGQRAFTSSADEYALLDIRKVEFEGSDDSEPAAPTDG